MLPWSPLGPQRKPIGHASRAVRRSRRILRSVSRRRPCRFRIDGSKRTLAAQLQRQLDQVTRQRSRRHYYATYMAMIVVHLGLNRRRATQSSSLNSFRGAGRPVDDFHGGHVECRDERYGQQAEQSRDSPQVRSPRTMVREPHSERMTPDGIPRQLPSTSHNPSAHFRRISDPPPNDEAAAVWGAPIEAATQ